MTPFVYVLMTSVIFIIYMGIGFLVHAFFNMDDDMVGIIILWPLVVIAFPIVWFFVLCMTIGTHISKGE